MNIIKRLFSQALSPTITPIANSLSETMDSQRISMNPTDKQDDLMPEDKAQRMQQVYTISTGTHMAIDAIYVFLDRDFEGMGYDDAMCSIDASFKESGVRIIRNELKTLFRRVQLRYNEDKHNLDITINLVKAQGLLSQASALESKMKIIDEHLEELKLMERNLDNEETSMMRPFESYNRGFLKGLTAKTQQLLT